MLMPRSPRRQSGQWSLIGTLVAVALLILLAALYIPKLLTHPGPDASEQTAIQEANGVACGEYLSQLNMAVSQYKQDNGRAPTSLNDLKKYGVTDDMINAPGCSFQMDPNSGRVTNGPAPSPGAPPAPAQPNMQTLPNSQPASGSPPAPAPSSGTPGPGGITIPNIPGSGG